MSRSSSPDGSLSPPFPPYVRKRRLCPRLPTSTTAAPLVLVLPPTVPDKPFPIYEEEGLVRTQRLLVDDGSPDPQQPRQGQQNQPGASCSGAVEGGASGVEEEGGFALIETSETCACNTRDGLAVVQKWKYQHELNGLNAVAVVCRDETSRVGHVVFQLPSYDPSEESTRTVLIWLLCTHFKFYTFRTRVVKGEGLQRGLVEATEALFSRSYRAVEEGRRLSSSCSCIEYRLKQNADVVFFLKKCVVSGNRRGPTIESVVNVDFDD